HERLHLSDELRALPQLKVGVDSLLESVDSQLLEPADLALSEGLEGEIRKGRPPPKREAVPQLHRSLAGLRLPSFGQQALEARGVELLALEPEHVARRRRDNRLSAEQPAKLRDEILERGGCRLRRVLAPQLIDDPISRDDRARVEEEQTEESSLPRTSERDGSVLV